MKAILIAISVILVSLVMMGAGPAWERPEDCPDDQREIPGNHGSPCEPVFPEIQSVEYRVVKEYPSCIEELVFHMPGLIPTNGSDIEFDWGDKHKRRESARWYDPDWRYDGEHLVVRGYSWNLNSRIQNESRFGNPTPNYPYIAVRPVVRDGRYSKTYSPTPFALRPPTDNLTTLVNACLSLVRQDLEDREHVEKVAQEEAAAAARRQAERDAEEKLQEQALRDAEAQARIAAEDLSAAQRNLEIARQTEIIRTQTLQARLLHAEAVALILEDIVRVRLAGQTDRARLTNEYLVRAEAVAAEFNVDVAEIEKTIQDYLDFNSELLVQLASYRENIDAQLARVEAELAEHQARIEALGREPEVGAVDPETSR